MMKKLTKVLLVLAMAFVVTACGGTNSETHLIIGTSPDYLPFEGLNNKGEMIGFDIDMAEELINIMNKNGGNYTYELKSMSFDTIRPGVEANPSQVDLGIAGFTKHDEWDVAWSHKYNDSKQVALVAGDSKLSSLKDLEGKKIGVQLSSNGENCAKAIKGATVKSVTDVKVMVETLRTGGVDAVILDAPVAENYVKEAGFKMIEEPLNVEENLIIINKNNEELLEAVNKALDEFVGSEKYTQLKEKWGA